MASEDVIELGSSEDEAEPAPKKMKPKPKPKPNAMVLIPNKLPGVTIKPAKTNKNPVQRLVGKGVTVTKVNKIPNIPVRIVKKPNGRPTPIPIAPKPPTFGKNVLSKPIPIASHPTINPLSLMKKLTSSQVMINKVPSTSKMLFYTNPIKIQSPKTINKMHPNITIIKTQGGPKRPANAPGVSNVRKKPRMSPKIAPGEVLTVELDDDDVTSSSTASPQWYLRPEEQKESQDIEKKNNAEPAPSNLIEITIEDSPVKPKIKRANEVGAELAITIEDSPVKLTEQGNKNANSDNETSESNKEPHSKKKLEYPKETDIMVENSAIEIEVEPMEGFSVKDNETINCEKISNANEHVIEVEESPLKKADTPQNTPKKKEGNHKPKIKEKVTLMELETPAVANAEFHPVYQSFIDLCFKLENSEDMKKIVEKKIKAYYKQAPKEYTESEDFIDMVSSKVLAMRASPEKMYLYIKDIVDELNLQRKLAKSQKFTKDAKSAEQEKFSFDDSEFDSKRQRQIRKLEKTLKKLHRAIQKLEEQEVDFDDEEDSVYLLTERYKERMIRVHAKFCQLTNTKMPSEPRLQIDARPGQPSGPAKRLEKYVNKKVPIGTPLPFPDFHDVLRCVREANEEDKLGWNEADIMEEARDLFTRCGKKLQRRRQENEWRLAVSRIPLDVDPAEENEDLKKKLEQNLQLATKKETDVFNKYADRQSQLKLEAEEIGDKEAEESPEESEDDEPAEEKPALEDKEKRKERLKRLIQEKAKKDNEKGKKSPKETENSQSDIEMILEETSKDEGLKDAETASEIKNMEENSGAKNDLGQVNELKSKTSERVHSISDDNSKVDSDVDELHLLQKLHSENEVNTSTVDSSDTDTPINISDTLPSSSDNKGKLGSDVISIENSSYSESETGKDTSNSKIDEMEVVSSKDVSPEIVDVNVQKGCSTDSIQKKRPQSNNGEYNDSVENILLASSDDEVEENKNSGSGTESCVNLKDDTISIGDTVIQGADIEHKKSKIDGVDGVSEKNVINNENKNSKTDGLDRVSEKNVINNENKNSKTDGVDGVSETNVINNEDKNSKTDGLDEVSEQDVINSEDNSVQSICSTSAKPENNVSVGTKSVHNEEPLDHHDDNTNKHEESSLTRLNGLEDDNVKHHPLQKKRVSQIESQLTKDGSIMSTDQTEGLKQTLTKEILNKVTNENDVSSSKINEVNDGDGGTEMEPKQLSKDNDNFEILEESTILGSDQTPVKSLQNLEKTLGNIQNDTKDDSLADCNTEHDKDKNDSLDNVLEQLQSDLELAIAKSSINNVA